MDKKLEFTAQAFSKMLMHAMKYPHCSCSGFLLSPTISKDANEEGHDGIIRMTEAIPISHNSNCLGPIIEIAYNSVSLYAAERELVISGFYFADRINGSTIPDLFTQKVSDRINEAFPNSIMCLINFQENITSTVLDPYQFVDGKWRRRASKSIEIENEADLSDNILYTKENLYRKIVDFDDHFDDITLDWSNSIISQKIDSIMADVC